MTTLQLSMLALDNSTLSPLDFHAKTSALPEIRKDWTAIVQDSSMKSSESFASADPVTSSWKTSQPCLLPTTGEIWQQYSGSFPKSGTMRNGKLYRLNSLDQTIAGSDYGLLPTPTASDNRSRSPKNIHQYKTGGFYLQTTKGKSCARLSQALAHLGREDLTLSPTFREWMMGYPRGWTEAIGQKPAVKALGNSIVPQCAMFAFQRILDLEALND